MYISSTREKILRLFFNSPELRIHQRGIARRARINPQNAHQYLQEFEEEGLLLKSEVPQFALYSLNPKNSYLFKIFEMFELKKKEEFISSNEALSRKLQKYMKVLSHLSKKEIRAIILFGPAAGGDWTPGNQVDILTITASKVRQTEIHIIHKAAAQKVRHMLNISSINFTVDEVIQGFRKKKKYFVTLWQDRIILYNEFLFWQIIRESQTRTKSLIL